MGAAARCWRVPQQPSCTGQPRPVGPMTGACTELEHLVDSVHEQVTAMRRRWPRPAQVGTPEARLAWSGGGRQALTSREPRRGCSNPWCVDTGLPGHAPSPRRRIAHARVSVARRGRPACQASAATSYRRSTHGISVRAGDLSRPRA
jgi:hypothetical protein